ncbi:FtsK/SpoIIIE domain-containing protein [Priestia koreensis]|uniref:FtsK/SpoIIIE domain-containing protein n=1 Tax=Priestia koreensis TaxID=284581 RepID=UPI003D002136
MFLAKVKSKAMLMKCFKSGEIYIKTKSGDRTFYRYPKINDVEINLDERYLRYVFTLPNGCDPDLVLKREWVFNQYFGKNVEIKGDKFKRFIVTVFEGVGSKFKFNFEDLKEKANKYRFPVIAGKDEYGKFHMFDMLENPHMLVMGETGSGKSVYLRANVTFISLYLKEKVEIYLCDMKRTEFFLFRNLNNVKSVSMNKHDVLRDLNKIERELQRRGNLFDEHEVAHIDDYNKVAKKKLPYILLCIDEVALLRKEKKQMEAIENISCIGRALGCLMILSMQRGDAKILDGNLKNNLTVRAVFRCADKTNSDIGLGKGSEFNASKILKSEKGKFYFKLEDTQLMQAPLLELETAKKMLEPYKITPTDKEAHTEQSEASEEVSEETINEFNLEDVFK